MSDVLSFSLAIVSTLASTYCGYGLGRSIERGVQLRRQMADLDMLKAESLKRSAILKQELLRMGIDPDEERLP